MIFQRSKCPPFCAMQSRNLCGNDLVNASFRLCLGQKICRINNFFWFLNKTEILSKILNGHPLRSQSHLHVLWIVPDVFCLLGNDIFQNCYAWCGVFVGFMLVKTPIEKVTHSEVRAPGRPRERKVLSY